MLYVFHGTDVASSGKKARSLIDSLRLKRPDASYVAVDSDSWSSSIIEEHLGGQGLFSNKYIIFLDRVSENLEAKELLSESAAAMQESPNIFIVLEGKLNVDLTKSFDNNAEKIVISDTVAKTDPKDEFNVFALADAVGQRDSFNAWSEYRQAIDSGIEPENIVGTIFWQLKSMTLAADSNNAAGAGLSPFVYSKAKRAVGNYSAQELDNITLEFITMYHDGHRGKVDLESSVERTLLNLATIS